MGGARRGRPRLYSSFSPACEVVTFPTCLSRCIRQIIKLHLLPSSGCRPLQFLCVAGGATCVGHSHRTRTEASTVQNRQRSAFATRRNRKPLRPPPAIAG